MSNTTSKKEIANTVASYFICIATIWHIHIVRSYVYIDICILFVQLVTVPVLDSTSVLGQWLMNVVVIMMVVTVLLIVV